jgi:hypothetical protein
MPFSTFTSISDFTATYNHEACCWNSALRSAGHGDTIAIVDINFPAFEVAQKTTYGKVIPLAGASAEEALAAVASVCPVDLFVDQPLQSVSFFPSLFIMHIYYICVLHLYLLLQSHGTRSRSQYATIGRGSNK